MVRHLKTHGIKLSKATTRRFHQIITELGVLTSTTVTVPDPRGPPVELLAIKPDGYCCNECNFCFPGFGGFKKHWSRDHKNHEAPTMAAYHKGSIQTFFQPTNQRWFEVLPAMTNLPTQDVFATYLEKQVPKFKSTLISAPVHVHEVPPLLQVTGWHTHLANFIKTQEGVRDIQSLVQVPFSKETKGLDGLRDVVFKYMKDVRAKAQASTIGVKCLLMECPR
jgi:hypothetical protein